MNGSSVPKQSKELAKNSKSKRMNKNQITKTENEQNLTKIPVATEDTQQIMEIPVEQQQVDLDLYQLNDIIEQDDDEDEANGELTMLGKRDNFESQHPLKAMMIHNLNQSHNTQRRRDIKTNYKAKLPLDKLIVEHEKKKSALRELIGKRVALTDRIQNLWDRIGIKRGIDIDIDMSFLTSGVGATAPEANETNKIQIKETEDDSLFVDQTEILQKSIGKCHWDFLLKEMEWMAEDFDRETKKNQGDAKKFVRNCKKHLHEKQITQEKQIREQKVELKRKSKFMSNIVQLYWKSCDKIVRHNYNIEYEKKRQQQRTKKLENFVSKHLKLSVKVAQQLNTNQFVQQSLYKTDDKLDQIKTDPTVLNVDDGQKQIKIYDSQEHIEMKHLDKEEEKSNQSIAEEQSEIAQNYQPTGHTLDQAKVSTQVPFLLRGELREYQIIGMDWMVTLHNRKLNGILADEMGLGKTIQTIALLASLACDKGIWGPHLIVVPTTIIMNWEIEFKKWCPGFKILTYFGSQRERRIKRHGWSKDNSFHICITSYKLVIQDHFAFRRKKWYYMILDEAQNIKNFKSQRWQTMLRFNTKRRLLLTGTPLQNDVMELWSLMHFLMPNIFANMQDFKEWFSNPFSQSVNQNKSLSLRVVQKLQSILRPFLLRRMKREVEKQLPEKIEHIVQCNLSRRQRLLYDEYINHDKTRNVLADSDFFSIMSVLMQLRKVCNHPDLFEARTIESPFILNDQDRISYSFPTEMLKELQVQSINTDVDLYNLNFKLIDIEKRNSSVQQRQVELLPLRSFQEVILSQKNLIGPNESIYTNNRLGQDQMTSRPFEDGLSIGQLHHTNSHSLHKQNCSNLMSTIPNIMPYDIGVNYQMQYHKVPGYLKPACLPFSQQYFSIPNYDTLRYQTFGQEDLNPVNQYISAMQKDEHKQMLIKLARKLAIWHSIDRQNRLQITFGQPIYGTDVRKAIEIKLVCSDVFDAKRFKYINWKSKEDMTSQYNMTQSVFNPCCKYNPDIKSRDVIIENWPQQSDAEIEHLNQNNLLIKEITIKTREALRLQKEKKEHDERMRQPKKVQRKTEIEEEYTEDQILLIIDLAAIGKTADEQEQQVQLIEDDVEMKQEEEVVKEEDGAKEVDVVAEVANAAEATAPVALEAQDANDGEAAKLLPIDLSLLPENPNVQVIDEKITKTKTITRTYEEIITYEEYLIEQKHAIPEAPTMPSADTIRIDLREHTEPKQKEKQEKEPDDGFQRRSISYKSTETLTKLIISPMQRASDLEEIVKNFKIIIPKVVSKPVEFIPSKIYTKHQKETAYEKFLHQKLMQHKNVNQSLKYSNILFFPHKNLIQYDCGKLQKLAQLLKTLYNKGSKVIIFTQMTKMLDIFEQFLNLHGYIYVRLDGSVKTENRQKLVDRFNFNKKIFCFISSTRCGGVGINLTGADCVIFYDTDWNPSMDKQAQDRCHRIGQTKTVHIYRLISINTIEENIFKKSLQKRELGGLIIEGNFNQEFFQKTSIKDILTMDKEGASNQVGEEFKPKKLDIFKDENLVFDDIDDKYEAQDKYTTKLEAADIDFQANDEDLEKQQQEFERQQKIEQYRRRFEEALIRIEDQEDVVAMQDAKRERLENDDEDKNEFDGMVMEENNVVSGENPEMQEQIKLQKEELEKLRQKQKINDGISLTQGEIKKNESIDWNENVNLNKVTKQCIRYTQANFSFEEYLEDRAKKDAKFVNINEEDDKNEGNNANDNERDEENKSEFSFSEDGDTKESSGKHYEWDRSMAQKFYDTTKTEITTRLINGVLEREQANIHSQPMPEIEIQIDEKMEDDQIPIM